MQEAENVSQKLIKSHLISGKMIKAEEIGLKIDQTLTQDATGTLVMLELEAMNVKKVKTEVSVQYVDHNLIQSDYKNADDHIFLQSATRRFGLWYSRAGNGVSHPVHMERFGIPGKSLVGSDSHTSAAGSLGMLSFGSGGLDVAFAMIGEPLYIQMPEILGVKLSGSLPAWVSAKDVVLEMLRRYDVKGCKNKIIEYYGPGLNSLSAMDRHVIANMGTEMGATTTVFPSDENTLKFLRSQGRENDWIEIKADEGAEYDQYDEIELSELQPLIACPSSPGKVVRVKDVAGREIYQSVIGSSANPGLRDFWIVAEILKDRSIHERVSLDINPTSRQVIDNLAQMGAFQKLIRSGARFHQSGCMGCIGMGQAPASGKISLRTMPRNFPGRSGTKDDQVYLCSPETAAASALTGVITDPGDLEKLYGMKYPQFKQPEKEVINTLMLIPPLKSGHLEEKLIKGPNIKTLPNFEILKNDYKLPVILKMQDNISTDEILPAGTQVLPFRSNIPEISKYSYYILDDSYYEKAINSQKAHGGHIVIAGENYAQGSSREHAALAPKYLGQIAVIAKSYARIGWQNLANFGIIPFEFENPDDHEKIQLDDILVLNGLIEKLTSGNSIIIENQNRNENYKLKHSLSKRQLDVIVIGGVINYFSMNKT